MENKKCLISLQSQTYSLKAIMLLAENGIKAKAIILDRESRSKGCTSGIEIDCENQKTATKILNSSGIKFGIVK